MTIQKQKNGNELTLSLAGRLDTMTAPELEAALSESLDGVSALTIDLAELEYISSAGLRVLLATHKAMLKQGKMVIRHANETVMEIFALTGFTELLTLEN